jgi:hypothetical protein
MTSLPLYSRERIEELRSRISLLSCSLEMIRQDYWAIFHTFFIQNKTPPFVYPRSAFERLNSLIEDLETISEHVNPDALPDTVYRCFVLDVETTRVLDELARLQNVLAQRISSLGTMKLLEFQEILQIEYGIISKAYNAVDALTFELVEKILGPSWITDNSYTPISLFDSIGYAIDLYSNIISVPYYDSFRARFWPALAHEVAHILVNILAAQEGPFRAAMLDGVSRLLEILEYRFDSPEGREIASLQLTELTCDVIAAYACPASVLSACAILSLPFEEEDAEGALKEAFKELSHPPSDVRIALMRKVLEKTGILEADSNIVNFLDGVAAFMAGKNFSLLTPSSHEFINEYSEFAKNYSQEVVDLLPEVGVHAFKKDNWSVVRDAFEHPSETKLSPIELICLDWIKRMKTTKNDGHLSLQDFFRKRKNETKIYEQMVNSMYDYYERSIAMKTREVRPFDIRINTCEG